MTPRVTLYALLTLAVAAVRAAGAAPHPDTHARPIGVANREFADPERSNWAGTGARSVRVTLWYPSDGGGVIEQADNEGERVPVLRGGRIADLPERFPLIMLSHGSGGSAAQVFWLGHSLAQHGFLVAALDHNGTSEEELGRRAPTLTDFFGWERARDVSVALTQLLADPEFSARIDAARIGAAGFSLGATTALWTAGARLDLEKLRRDSPLRHR